MSPAALKYQNALNLPTIVSSLMVADSQVEPLSNGTNLTIAHSTKMTNGLLKDWMKFTNVLGNGIFDNI